MDKYRNEAGQVAVLVSPNHTLGWSTVNSPCEFFAMDKGLVEMKLRHADESEVKQYASDQADYLACMDGWADTEIQWVDEGCIFRIHEYDGAESIQFVESLHLIA